MAIGVCKTFRDPLHTDNATPSKDPSILRTECELRQQAARRRDRDLGADLPKAEKRQSAM
eukprot:2902181-Pleurochrysis_carterae.AAC.1